MSSLHSILTLFFSLSTTTPNSYTLSLHDALPILWRGRPWEQAVVYELHTGTFSDSGTYEGIERRLDYLADLGVNALELMPLSAFPGERNWGYDGVLPFAPSQCYGSPDDLKRLVQAAHEREMMVDRKSTRLNSSHVAISYAVFCL